MLDSIVMSAKSEGEGTCYKVIWKRAFRKIALTNCSPRGRLPSSGIDSQDACSMEVKLFAIRDIAEWYIEETITLLLFCVALLSLTASFPLRNRETP
jgi:hypothetical protein